MKSFRKIISLVLAIIITLTFFLFVPAFKEHLHAGNASAGNCDWVIDSGVLTITPKDGTYGTLSSFTSDKTVPWLGNPESITKIVIKEGVKAGDKTIGMFCNCSNVTEIIGLSNLDTSSVTDMNGMFNGCASLTTLDLSNFNTSNVTNMISLFSGCKNLTELNVSTFHTSKVVTMYSMFSGCSGLTRLDLSSFDTANVTTMESMFSGCSKLEKIYVNTFSTVKLDPDVNIFSGCTSLKGGANTAFDSAKLDSTYAKVDGGKDSEGYFTYSHIHSFTYSITKTTADNDTLKATCGAAGSCFYTDTTLTIKAPGASASNITYDGTAKNASFVQSSFLGRTGAMLPTITYEYKATKDGSYAATTDTKKAGWYKASFSFTSGKDIKTAYVEYVIEKAPLTVEGTTVSDKTYDGNTTASATAGSLQGVIGSDNVTLSGTSAEFAKKDAGIDRDVTVTYTLSGTDAGNYSIEPETLSASITQKKLTISGTTVSDKTYDGTTAANASKGEFSGKVGSDDVTLSVASAEFEDKNVGTDLDVTVTYTLSGTDADNYETPGEDHLKAEIKKKQLTVSNTTVSNKDYDGTTSASATAGSLSGVIDSDEVTLSVESAVFAQKDVGTGLDVTVPYGLSGSGAGNYDAPITETLKADITPIQLNISGTEAEDKIYDGTTSANVIPGTLEGVLTGEGVTVEASATFDSKHVGEAKTVAVVYTLVGEESVTKNYEKPADAEATASIEPKEIEVSADDKSSYVGSDLVGLTYVCAADALCTGDTFTGALETEADKDVVADYDIKQGALTVNDGNSGNNYSITFNKGTYQVTEKEIQTLSFADVTDENVTKTYGDDSFTLTVSGAETAVTYSSTNPTVATVDPSTGEVTILKAGSTIIKAAAEETSDYAKASVQYALSVNKLKVEVPQVETGLVYNGEEQTGVVLPKNAHYTLSGNSGTDAGSYTATATLTDKANCEWNKSSPTSENQTFSFSIGRKAVTVTAQDKHMFLGDQVPTFTAKVSGLLGEDTILYSFKAVQPKGMGAYSIVPEGEAVQGNYDVQYVQGILTVDNNNNTTKVDSDALTAIYNYYKNDPAYANKKVSVLMQIDKEISETDCELIASKVTPNKKIEYVNASLYLTVMDASDTIEKNIGGQNNIVIPIAYQFDYFDKANIQVYRAHEGVVDELTETPNEDGEFVAFNRAGGIITVSANKYSTYAFVYDSNEVPNTGDFGSLPMYLSLAGLALAGAALILCLRGRRKKAF